jgi:hypothetical protein
MAEWQWWDNDRRRWVPFDNLAQKIIEEAWDQRRYL